MTLFPRHRPHPDITNPFAFHYFLEFLRRNWLVWTVLVGGAVFFYFWVGAEAWRLIRAHMKVEAPIPTVVFHASSIPLPLEDQVPFLTGPILTGRTILGVAQYQPTSPSMEKAVLWLVDIQKGEAIGCVELEIPHRSGTLYVLGDGQRELDSIYFSVMTWRDNNLRLHVWDSSYRGQLLQWITDYYLLNIARNESLTIVYHIDLKSAVLSKAARIDDTGFMLSGFLQESEIGYGITAGWDEGDVGGIILANFSKSEFEFIPLEVHDVVTEEEATFLLGHERHTFTYDLGTQKARVIARDETSSAHRFRFPYPRNTKWNLEIESLHLKDAQTGRYEERRFLLHKEPDPVIPKDGSFDEGMFTWQSPPAWPAPDNRDYHTSSTLLMMFAGEDHLLRVTAEGWKLERLDDFLKAHPPRQVDLNELRPKVPAGFW